MAKHPTPTPRHAITRAVAVVEQAVAGVADTPAWSMSPDETASTLLALTRLTARISELEARVAQQAAETQVGEATGATSTKDWWAHATKQTRAAAYRKMALAESLPRYGLVRDHLAAGDMLEAQAHVIIWALDRLPDDLEPETRALAEKHLVDLAADHDAKDLRILGRHVLDVIDPAAGEEAEAKSLEEEERRARAKTRLTMSDDGHGSTHGRYTIPTAQAGMLKKILLAIAAPKHQTAVHGAGVERRPGPERMGQAFCELIENYPTDRLPSAGGVNATIVVTIPLDTLTGGLKAASLDTGDKITATQARRLACEAGIIPAVLGGKSQVLDLGRKNRYFSPAQRIAMGLEQHGCTAQGCDWPPGLCHGHHDTRWSHGGPHRPQTRPPPLPQTPHPSPRPHVHHDEASRRQGRLHQTDVGRPEYLDSRLDQARAGLVRASPDSARRRVRRRR